MSHSKINKSGRAIITLSVSHASTAGTIVPFDTVNNNLTGITAVGGVITVPQSSKPWMVNATLIGAGFNTSGAGITFRFVEELTTNALANSFPGLIHSVTVNANNSPGSSPITFIDTTAGPVSFRLRNSQAPTADVTLFGGAVNSNIVIQQIS